MIFINYISIITIPIVILLIVIYGTKDKINIFDSFIEGVREGINIIINVFPTLLGLFVAIGFLRASGIVDLVVKFISPVANMINIPTEIIPLAILRPISGSSSIAIATDIMKTYGVDSKIGLIASIIMGSTETTVYTIAVYTSGLRIKKNGQVLIIALIGDFIGIITSIMLCNILY